MVATVIPDNGGSLEFKDRLQGALKIGVKIAMADLWFAPSAGMSYGQAALRDLQALHYEGMPNVDVIRGATINRAALMGWSDLVGEIVHQGSPRLETTPAFVAATGSVVGKQDLRNSLIISDSQHEMNSRIA